jgi:serine-type D-Ala-D-Ala carboxypeptidase
LGDDFARVRTALETTCGREFTGAVARIEHRGRLVFERAYGVTRNDALAVPVFCDTPFDLASLTKLFVATMALQAVDEGRLDLDEPLSRVLPEWSAGERARITARMLLSHTSGMNSGADYRAILDENVERFALASDLVARPGERVIYSDLGFIVLGVVLERAAGRALATQCTGSFGSSPLFRPAQRTRAAIPATEEDDWRGRVAGFVHDEKGYLMGGVAGHAGLFGTAADVAAMTEWYLGPLHGRREKPLSAHLVRQATTEQADDPTLRRGLGWALKTNNDNSCGRLMTRSSFGHTGFVGTCVWADPVRDLQGVLLTNAVYFGRDSTSSEPGLRRRFYEGMVEDLHL